VVPNLANIAKNLCFQKYLPILANICNAIFLPFFEIPIATNGKTISIKTLNSKYSSTSMVVNHAQLHKIMCLHTITA